MATRVYTAALQGIEPVPILIEVDLIRRLPKVSFVGLAAGAVQEAAERVRSAILAIGKEFPRQRIVVNLAPADVRKQGTSFDLPVALGILAADGQLPADSLQSLLAVGELGLGGELRAVPGITSLALYARSVKKTLLVPRECASQAAMVPGVQVLAADHLSEVVEHLTHGTPLADSAPPGIRLKQASVDLSEVKGQSSGRRALEIAAAGGHHLRFAGPPGCGKSMLTRRLSTILPPLTFEEALEVTQIHSAAGLLKEDQHFCSERPFRSPHHTITVAGMVGDRRLRPGEISLAHHGILFLDEACEFPRSLLEVLRTPLEEGVVRLARAEGSVTWPAAITLVLATNPCPCGRRGGPLACKCTDGEVFRYRRRLSGPMEDRIDLHLDLPAVRAEELHRREPSESSAAVRQRVLAARERQNARHPGITNGRIPDHELERHISATATAHSLLLSAIRTHHLSGRGVHRLWRLARTIADLDDSDRVAEPHLAEALAFRPDEEMVK